MSNRFPAPEPSRAPWCLDGKVLGHAHIPAPPATPCLPGMDLHRRPSPAMAPSEPFLTKRPPLFRLFCMPLTVRTHEAQVRTSCLIPLRQTGHRQANRAGEWDGEPELSHLRPKHVRLCTTEPLLTLLPFWPSSCPLGFGPWPGSPTWPLPCLDTLYYMPAAVLHNNPGEVDIPRPILQMRKLRPRQVI